MYVVAINAPGFKAVGDRPIVFHALNKSGSLAMQTVLRAAYFADNRAQQFFSYKRGMNEDPDDMQELMNCSSGHRFFVAHYLYGLPHLPADAVLVSQVRHPLPRVLSTYGWARRNYERRHGTTDGMPTLAAFIESDKRHARTQMSQFAVGFAADRAKRLRRMSADDLLEVAIENLENDFHWIGIAEYFEESIFALAHLCGLTQVPAWQKDTRNRWRQPLTDTDPEIVNLIRDLNTHEFLFYEHAVALFRTRVAHFDFGATFPSYCDACSQEYGERLLLA